MTRKLWFISASFVLVLALSGSAQGQAFHWSGAVDDDYGNVGNWVEGAYPGDDGFLIDSSIDTTGGLCVATNNNARSKGDNSYIGLNGYGQLTVENGRDLDMDAAGYIDIGNTTSSGLVGDGKIIITDGAEIDGNLATMYVGGQGEDTTGGLRANGTLHFTKTAGTSLIKVLHIAGHQPDPGAKTSNGHVQVDGGILKLTVPFWGGEFYPLRMKRDGSGWTDTTGASATLDITGSGEVWLTSGDWTGNSYHQQYLANGWITGYGIPGNVIVTVEYGVTIMKAGTNPYAWDPYPADGDVDIPVDAQLEWNIPTDDPCSWKYTYEVYVSTDPDFIGVTPITAGPLTFGETRVTGVEPLNPPGDLDKNAEYFWRVDVVDPNDGFPVTRTGFHRWSFKTVKTLELVSPPDTYVPEVPIDVDLVWLNDPAAASHEVFLGLAGNPVSVGIQTTPYNPYNDSGVAMDWGTQYEWYVVGLDGGGTPIPGSVSSTWKFQTHTLICNNGDPYPGDINGDCIFDLIDFAVLAGNWLDCKWSDPKACP